MKKARIEIIIQANENDASALADLKEIKQSIESGKFQRDSRKGGARKITARFEWLEK